MANLVFELLAGLTLGVVAGFGWKKYHWDRQRRHREVMAWVEQGKE
eukprot:CAMPEP_0206126306 /NCGR_PEP_ID=MMETSP1472-20131121/21582_1 /ASSEMBLY_ACC=CAM_ASM_001108 /TAXON_ID=41880 /ORGANISM="Pycnococcus provasolii, Strain RCC251" /LENGTH=45 /DNA_ID= /DNA_START= /DNA_END= /DNA_ORIENTATION=